AMDRREGGERRNPLPLHHGALRAVREVPADGGGRARPVPLQRLALQGMRAARRMAPDLGLLRRGDVRLLARPVLRGEGLVGVVGEDARRGHRPSGIARRFDSYSARVIVPSARSWSSVLRRSSVVVVAGGGACLCTDALAAGRSAGALWR